MSGRRVDWKKDQAQERSEDNDRVLPNSMPPSEPSSPTQASLVLLLLKSGHKSKETHGGHPGFTQSKGTNHFVSAALYGGPDAKDWAALLHKNSSN